MAAHPSSHSLSSCTPPSGVVSSFAFNHNESLKGRLALITGASSGIGLATAEILASRGADLILTARRKDRLDQVGTDLKNRFGIRVTTVECDLTERAQVETAFAKIADLLPSLSILINNAGLAIGVDSMQTGRLDDWDAMIDTNLKGLLTVTRLSLPHLLKQASLAHVVNLGSVAGRYVYPGGAVYCATKFAVRALTEGLRIDVAGTGVRVTNIEPGMVKSEFSEVRFAGDKDRAEAVYKGMDPLTTHDIAETIVWCLDRPARVNIQELVIYPTDQAAIGHVSRNKK